MTAFLADALTVAGLVMAYIGVGVFASVVGTAAVLKVKELWHAE